MKNWLSFSILLFFIAKGTLFSQSWKPDTAGIFPFQYGNIGDGFNIRFKTNGPMGKDWIYGGYWDSDSLRRNVAYRENGEWVPLPFSGYYGNLAYDIEMYGDTLYIGGDFGDIVLDSDSGTLPNTGLLKWFNDSLWTDTTIVGPVDMSTKGDTLLISGSSYYNPPNIIFIQFMTTNGGQSWQYPYSIVHPTESWADFGAVSRLKILDNGDILTINNGSPRGNPFSGLSRWDGQQWHGYGNGLSGSFSRTFDFEFYKGELYMGGTFNKYDFPNDPANFVARWDGNDWQDLATGIEGGVRDLFVYDNIMYTSVTGGGASTHRFGDVAIPFFAGWDGHQWCGTPFNFENSPQSFGFINDTLYVTFDAPSSIDGNTRGYMHYYTGDLLHGPKSICSTLGLGEEEATFQNEVRIYPNPVHSLMQISLTEGKVGQLKVYDLNGRCVLEKDYKGLSLAEMDVSHLAPGIYTVTINGKYNQKLVKL